MNFRISLLLFIFTILFNSNIFGATSFKYQYESNKENHFSFEVMTLIHHFEEFQYKRLNPNSKEVIPVLNVEEAMTSSNGDGIIYIKSHLMAPKDQRFKVISMTTPNTNEHFYVFHTDETSMAFFNLTQNEVQLLTKTISKNNEITFYSSISFNSYADTIKCTQNIIPPPTNLSEFESSVEYKLLLDRMQDCALNAYKGAKEQVQSTVDFFKTLINDPAALWEKVHQNFIAFKNFVGNFNNEIKNIYKMIKDMDLDQKLELICPIAGQATVGFLTSLTGAGAGYALGKLLLTTIPKIKKVQSLSKIFKDHKLKFNKTKELMSCEL
jgi:hypothetical protein